MRCLESTSFYLLSRKQDAFVFSTSNILKVSVVLFSLPDVKGALPPTVTVAFVYAAPTIQGIKIPTLTHKNFSKDDRCRAQFLPFYLSTDLFGESVPGLRILKQMSIVIVSPVVFQLYQFFSSCAHLLFLSFFLAEVFPDLVLLFLLSFACYSRPLIKEANQSLSRVET